MKKKNEQVPLFSSGRQMPQILNIFLKWNLWNKPKLVLRKTLKNTFKKWGYWRKPEFFLFHNYFLSLYSWKLKRNPTFLLSLSHFFWFVALCDQKKNISSSCDNELNEIPRIILKKKIEKTARKRFVHS